MPACLTHRQFIFDVMKRLPQPGADLCAYAWGAQGPDFLFCHRYLQAAARKELRSLQEYGSALHRTQPSLTLSAMREFLRRHEDGAYRSYVMGFLCHYALDSAAHPYVNARARQLAEERPWENASTMHCEIEAALDAIVLRWRSGKLPSEVKLTECFPKNEGVQRKIACLYREVLFTVYGTDVGEAELYQATKDARFIFAACTDRTGLKRQVFQRLERGKPGYVTSHLVPMTEDPEPDFANDGHAAWEWEGRTSERSFYELYEEAAERACRLIQGFDTEDLGALTEERPFG